MPSLSAKDIHLWAFDTNDYASHRDHFYTYLNNDEKERASRFKFDHHRNRHIICRGLLRVVLSTYLNTSPQDIQFEFSEQKKPFVPNVPLKFNISHSKHQFIIAITLSDEIGVDIEYSEKNVDALSIAKRFFSDVEYETLNAYPEEAQNEAFYRIWTRKEALLKAKGDGLFGNLKGFSVSASPNAKLLALEAPHENPRDWLLENIDTIPNFKGAIACPRKKETTIMMANSINDAIMQVN